MLHDTSQSNDPTGGSPTILSYANPRALQPLQSNIKTDMRDDGTVVLTIPSDFNSVLGRWISALFIFLMTAFFAFIAFAALFTNGLSPLSVARVMLAVPIFGYVGLWLAPRVCMQARGATVISANSQGLTLVRPSLFGGTKHWTTEKAQLKVNGYSPSFSIRKKVSVDILSSLVVGPWWNSQQLLINRPRAEMNWVLQTLEEAMTPKAVYAVAIEQTQ